MADTESELAEPTKTQVEPSLAAFQGKHFPDLEGNPAMEGEQPTEYTELFAQVINHGEIGPEGSQPDDETAAKKKAEELLKSENPEETLRLLEETVLKGQQLLDNIQSAMYEILKGIQIEDD
ncbi:uncharacterized protein LOC135370993 [Ornithodoros turicata]|uniref:uncharacterized protein LOC135370993 n=1 Tax=Ornithodoros turicata TaxID=34597 RepID=UPI00313927BE